MSSSAKAADRSGRQAHESSKKAAKPQFTAEQVKVLNYLRRAVASKSAVEVQKRVDYFRGEKLLRALMPPAEGVVLDSSEKKLESRRARVVPQFKSEDDAAEYAAKLMLAGAFHASAKVKGKKKVLQPIVHGAESRCVTASGYYTWMYTEKSAWSKVKIALLLGGFFSLCLFPIWPRAAKIGVWYISLTLLLFLLGLIFVRLIVFLAFWVFGIDVWIMPHLFDDDASLIEAFFPLIEVGRSENKNYLLRLALALAIAGGAYYLYVVPTDFDEYIIAQRKFVDDLYSGSLLSDMAHPNGKEGDDIPDFEAFLRTFESDDGDDGAADLADGADDDMDAAAADEPTLHDDDEL